MTTAESGGSRVVTAAVLLVCALVCGGWFIERGLLGAPLASSAGAQLFRDVYERVADEYVDTLADSTLNLDAARGLVDELHDPHSEYLSPASLSRFSESTSGQYAGIGAQIDVRDGLITIVAPLPGSPAQTAGLQSGDRVVALDGKPTAGLTVDAAQRLVRGAPNTVLQLTVQRPGVGMPLNFSVEREEIHVHSVQHARLLADSIGYVDLAIFSDQSAAELRHAVDSLRAAGMRSLLLDLRGDPGGLLTEGVGVAELFLDKGQRIVTIRGRSPGETHEYDDSGPQPWPSLPVAVLVDSNTASAAEIVSGALQDHDRALLLGTVTYGKGSAQNVYPLIGGGAVKLTTAKWFTPSGRSIDRRRDSLGVFAAVAPADSARTSTARPRFTTDAGRTVLGGGGITPDVVLPETDVTAADSTLQRAVGGGQHVQQFRDALTESALSVKARGGVASPDFVTTSAMRADLLQRLRAKGVSLDSATVRATGASLDRLLGYEVTRYVFGPDAEYARRLRDDPAVASAVRLMAGATSEQTLLQRAAQPIKR
jgi:carboxyl-terminal processing protease